MYHSTTGVQVALVRPISMLHRRHEFADFAHWASRPHSLHILMLTHLHSLWPLFSPFRNDLLHYNFTSLMTGRTSSNLAVTHSKTLYLACSG